MGQIDSPITDNGYNDVFEVVSHKASTTSFNSIFSELNAEQELKDRNHVEPTLTHVPTAYQVKQVVRKMKMGTMQNVIELYKTIPVENGDWIRAKRNALKISNNVINSIVVEISERILDANEKV